MGKYNIAITFEQEECFNKYCVFVKFSYLENFEE